jgi:hypothetical protein
MSAFPDVKAFPTTPAPAQAGLGHNRAPVDVMARDDFNEAIDAHKGIRQRINDLIGSADRANATDDESAGRCAELIRQMTAVEKLVDDERTKVKAPYLAAGRSVDDAAKALVSTLGSKKAAVRGKAESYLREKQAREAAERRRQEEERERLRREADERAREEAAKAAEENRAPDPEIMEAPVTVAAKPIEEAKAEVRSDFGALASTRKVWVGQVNDYAKAFKAVKSNPGVRDAIDKAVAALVRAGQREIPGVDVVQDVSLTVR